MTKNGEETRSKRIAQYERDGDECILNNTTISTRRTLIGFGTVNKIGYAALISNTEYEHVVYTNRDDTPNMKPLKSTLKIAQVSGELEPSDVTNSKWTIKSSFLFCSFPNCCTNPNNINNFMNYEHYLHRKDVLIAKGINEEIEDHFRFLLTQSKRIER